MSHPNCLHPLNGTDPDSDDAPACVTSPNLARASRSLKKVAGLGILLWASVAVAVMAGNSQMDSLAQLKKLLADRQWEAASSATWTLIAPNAQTGGLQQVDCGLLLEVDRLWTQASAGHFGFTAQEQVWQRLVMTPLPSDPNPDRTDRFRRRVGWDRYAPDSPEARSSKGYFPSDRPLATGRTLEFGCGDPTCSISRTQVEEQVSAVVEVLPALKRCLQ